MKKLILVIFLALNTLGAVIAQTYTSQNNRTQVWNDNATWGTTPPSTSITGTVNIYGNVTQSGNLSVSTSGGATLRIYDTLNVTGSFTNNGVFTLAAGGILNVASFDNTTSGSATASVSGSINVSGAFSNANDLTILSGGIITVNGNYTNTNSGSASLDIYGTLIVKGNFSTSSNVRVRPSGLLIVLGDLTVTNSGASAIINEGNTVAVGEVYIDNDITVSNQFFIFDDTPTFSWSANINGTSWNPGNNGTLTNIFPTEDDIPTWLQNILASLGVPLPVTLLYFQEKISDDGVVLNWATVTEENADYFEIQRSVNGIHFEKVGEVSASGNSKDLIRYNFTDERPLQGRNYYRLKTVDFDRSYEYSKIISVNWDSPKVVNVYPNPSSGTNISFKTNFSPQENDKIIILNSAGIEIAKFDATGFENEITFNSQLTPGIYFFKYISTTFEKTIRVSVVN